MRVAHDIAWAPWLPKSGPWPPVALQVRNVLSSLRIRNLALIDDVEIPLRAGLTVLTGETGAGKSIIVGALNLVLGDRAQSDAIRQGETEA